MPGGAGYFHYRNRVFCRCDSARLRLARKKPAPSPIRIAWCSWASRALDMPGDARQDLWIIQELAQTFGLLEWNYSRAEKAASPNPCINEMRLAMDGAIAGITWERLENENSRDLSVREAKATPVEPVVFDRSASRRRNPAERQTCAGRHYSRPTSGPMTSIPFVLITGRQLEHWHTGSMTRRASVLDALEPMATASMSGADLADMGLQTGRCRDVAVTSW